MVSSKWIGKVRFVFPEFPFDYKAGSS